MRIVVVAALSVVAACKAHDNFPVNPGGGGGPGGSGAPDAAIDGNDGGGNDQIVGRVCLASDPRKLTVCAGSGAEGLTVTLAGRQALTIADGAFTIARADTTSPIWQVTGAAIETSVMPFGTVPIIPALTITTYTDMLASNGVIVSTG